jgi:hypothetical protein
MIRKFQIEDFEQVKNLYAHHLNFSMESSYYQYLYFHDGSYTSFVYEENGEIIGHHAFIPYKQKINNVSYQIATFSGAVVKPEKSGVYLSLLKETIKCCKADIVVAFPNKNSQDFFTKLLKFSIIEQNYYTIEKSIPDIKFKADYYVEIDQNYIQKRFDLHPIKKYVFKQFETQQIAYKEYNGSLDILYCNQFNHLFIEFINNKLKDYNSINLVYHNLSEIEKLGFKRKPNNIFVYKILCENSLSIFPCQMFNSDVF